MPFIITAYIIDDDTQDAGDAIKGELERDLPPHSEPSVEYISISKLMRVRLVTLDGRDFEITPLHAEDRQIVSGAEPTNWSWSVLPLREGQDKRLELRVTAIIHNPNTGEEVSKEKRPQIITLSVNVTPNDTSYRPLTDYIWILGILIISITSYGVLHYLRNHNNSILPPSSKTNQARRTLTQARRTLATLEEQAAGYTSLTIPAHLKNELEDARDTVADLEVRCRRNL